MSDKGLNLTKAQIDAINNYNSEIQTIEDFVDMVRKRPGMYLGPIGNGGLLNMIREILQNALDQVVRPDSPATYAFLTFDEFTKQVIVEDNGLGIPFGELIRVFTKQHTSSHFQAKEGTFSAGLHGVGSKVTNAMSSKFIVRSYRLEEGREMSFTDGREDYAKEKVIPKKECKGRQGTIVMFSPAFDQLGELTLTCDEVLALVQLIIPLYPIGTKINYTAVNSGTGKSSTVTLTNDIGLNDYIHCKMVVAKENIFITSECPEMKLECMFNFNPEFNSEIYSFANFCPTRSGGTHLDGFLLGVSTWFKDYINKFFISSKSASIKNNKGKQTKKKDNLVELVDVKTALCGVVHLLHIEPNFTGQAKEYFSNQEGKGFVKSSIEKGLDEWSKKNPSELQKICKFIKTVAEIRNKEDNTKAKISTKYNSVLTGYPSKFTKPTGPKSQWEEVFFVEGDSAEGTAKFARLKAIQGIMPLRGKILNAFTNSREKILENAECAGMLTVIGGGEGKNFDLSKVPWKVIASLTDADIDGAHIAVLFLIFMLVYCRPAVEEGLVYKAQPPLYGAKKNGKQLFFGSRMDLTNYTQKEFLANNTIQSIDGTKLTHAQILKLFMKNEDYVYELNTISNSFAVNPYLLEQLLIDRNLSTSQIKKNLKREERFRFIKEIKDINNGIYIDGLVEKKSNTIYLNDRIITMSSEVTSLLDECLGDFNNNYFLLNGKRVGLYELISSYLSYQPSNITRYKGLGEMNEKQLRFSTMDPDGPRCMIRYTANDIIQEVENLREISSNLASIKPSGKVTRVDLLD